MKLRHGIPALVFFIAASAYATNETALIPRQVLFAPPDRSTIKLSADGTRIGFVAGGKLFTAPIHDVTKRDLLDDGPVVNYEWAFDNKHIVMIKGGHLFSFDFATRTSHDLGAGRIAKLSPRRPGEVLIATDAERPDLMRVDLTTGHARQVLRNPGYDQFYADFDFRPRIAVRETSDGGYELSGQNANGDWKVLYTIPLAATIVSRPIGVDGDGKVLYVVDNQNRDKAALKAVDLRTGKTSVLLGDNLADLTPFLMLDPRSGRVESATAPYARTRRLFANRALRRDFSFLRGVAAGDIGVAGRSADDNVWLVVFFNGGPARYYAYDRRARRASFLLTEYDALEAYPLARRQAVEYATRDGIRLPGDLFWPAWAKPGTPLPMVIVVHGGPSVAYPWNSWFTNRMLQLLANRGYLAFRVEFRGTGGLGKTIMHAGDREWGAKMNDDLIDAANWAAAQGYADRTRVAVMGWSYGGYAAVAALTFTPEAFACGVAMYPVTDLADLAQSDPIWREKLGDESTKEGRALLESRSPVHFAERVARPLLITHGAQDRRVPPAHSEKEVKALESAKKDVIFLRFTDEGHDYEQPKNLAAFFAAAELFLRANLGGRIEEVDDAVNIASLEILAGASRLREMM